MGTQTISAQELQVVTNSHFTMTVSRGYDSPHDKNMYCFDIEIEVHSPLYSHNAMTIYDSFGKQHPCTSNHDTFTWCYRKKCMPQNLTIEAILADPSPYTVYASADCIVVIEPRDCSGVITRL